MTVRKAKNDQKGMTRTMVLSKSKHGDASRLVFFWEDHCRICKVTIHPDCVNVPGEPDICSVCGPAFPSVLKHKGKQSYPMPKPRVTMVVKGVYVNLARH